MLQFLVITEQLGCYRGNNAGNEIKLMDCFLRHRYIVNYASIKIVLRLQLAHVEGP